VLLTPLLTVLPQRMRPRSGRIYLFSRA